MRKTTIKNLIHLLIISIPLLLLLVACIFPNKKSENYYNGTETTYNETETSIMFNQLVPDTSYTETKVWNNNATMTYTRNAQYVTTTLTGYGGTSSNLYLGDRLFNNAIYTHKYLILLHDCSFENGLFTLRATNNFNSDASISYSTLFEYSSDVQSDNYHLILTNNNNTDTSPFINFMVDCRYSTNVDFPINFKCYVNLFDLTMMFGYNNEPTYDEFISYFPLNSYSYNAGELLWQRNIETTTTINETSNIVYTQDTKQINTNIIKPINDFYQLQINNWYRDTLNLIGINYDNNNIVKTYIAYQPLWLMWFFLFELIEMILTAVPRILIRLTNKISGGGEV